jgi:MerR family redox-sensitive transcriptional activator SoxR
VVLTIGQVAARTGLRASAIRYYEELGLLPEPARRSGKRIYDGSIFTRLTIIDLAKTAGFELREIRALLGDTSRPPRSWREVSRRKRSAVDSEIARLEISKMVLSKLETCGCATIDDCGRIFRAAVDAYRAGQGRTRPRT